MNKKDTHCSACSKDFATRKDLTDHNACMRRLGKYKGHEVTGKSIAGSSKAGSQIGQEDQKMDDFNANKMMPPENIMRSSIGPKSILTSANPFGFVTGETDA